jgi:lipoyl(octanoyl) transferase
LTIPIFSKIQILLLPFSAAFYFHPMTNLRILFDFNRSAAFNMAADQYILSETHKDDTIFLRFYTWKYPSITLGYMQQPKETLRLDMCTSDNVEWIRRPTGGRAVLHKGDLTYSCIFPKSTSFLGSSVKESYAAITACLKNGFNKAGIPVNTHDSYDDLLAVKREIKLPCFLAPNRDEIMVDGRKLVGSAQKRTTIGVLQHGSIPISSGFADLPFYLTISPDEQIKQRDLLLAKSIWIHALNDSLSNQQLAQSLAEGFITCWNIPSCKDDWSDQEIDTINKIASSDDFTAQWMK